MQLLIDTNTDTLADLRSAIFVVECAIDVRQKTTGSMGQPESKLADDASKGPALALVVAPVAPVELTPDVFAANKDAPIPPAPAAPVPPAPVAVAPLAAVAIPPPPVVPVAGGEVDSKGLPHDARIHAETKAKNKDGSWRTRRNLAAGVLDAVTAELRGGLPPAPTANAAAGTPAAGIPAGAIPAPPAAPVATPAVIIPPPPPPGTAGSVPVPPPPPPPAAAGVLPGPPAVGLDFRTLMTRITGAMTAQKLTKAQSDEMLKHLQVEGMQGLMATPDKWEAAAAYLTRLGV